MATDNETTPTPTPPPTPLAPQSDEPRKPKGGDKVNVVLGDRTLTPGVIDDVKRGQVTVLFEHRGATVEITASPYDPTGTKPDSWNFAN